MFNFSLQNPYSFIIAFIPAVLNFVLVVYIVFALPRTRITNVFALLTFACVLWQTGDSLLRITLTAEGADFWDSIFCISWIFIGSLCLHFALLYTQVIKQYLRFYILFLYAPCFAFYALYEMHFYEHIFQPIPFWGWGNFHNKNPIDIAQIYWVSALVIVTLVLLIIYTSKIKNDRLLKRQALLITTGLGVPALTGVITQVLFPTLFHIPPVPLTSTFMTCLSIATVIALRKYKLFSVSDLVQNEVLIDSLPIILFSISTEKRITYMNNFALAVFGLTKKEISITDVKTLFSFETAEEEKKFNALYEKAINGGKTDDVEMGFNTLKGKTDVILSCNPVVNNNQVRGVLITARDITELKRSYKTIKSNEAMLQEAQKLSHIGSWEWDVPRDIITWSDELYRIFGYQPAEIPIKYETYLDKIHLEDRKFVNTIIQKAFKDHDPFNFYHRILRDSDEEVIVYARGEVLVDKNNNVIRMNGTAQDVTESKRKEEILKQQNEELQKINAELDKFVYSVSHDLRAPLTSMLGVVEISDEEANDAILHERLCLLKTSIKKLDQFILDILEHSRNARMGIRNEAIDFNEIVNDIIENLKYGSSPNEHNVDVRVNIKTKGCFSSDKIRIAIVLNNLVSNAIRYSNSGAPESFVKINIAADDKKANIVVEDNGIGIDKALHDKIFEMFYRVSNNSIGSGLGLYLVKECLKKLNGTIEVESEKGKGTLFRINIPNSQTN
jgi:PAS domain S-box-containing protein